MNQLVLMATPNGKWVLPASDEFLGALGDPNPDYDGPGFAIRNLGFIKLQMLDHTLIEIELHPRNVAQPALRAVIDQVMAAELKLFRIKYLKGGWQSEIAASPEHAAARLKELCAPVYRPEPASRFEAERRGFAPLIARQLDPFPGHRVRLAAARPLRSRELDEIIV